MLVTGLSKLQTISTKMYPAVATLPFQNVKSEDFVRTLNPKHPADDSLKYIQEEVKSHKPIIFNFFVLRPVEPIIKNHELPTVFSLSLAPHETPSINLCLQKMRENEKFADISIVCEEQEFKCHKVVLAAKSVVFDTMFSHEDTAESKSGKVVVTDVEPYIMEQLLNFIYADYCELSDVKDILKMLICADKYDISGLRNLCEDKLIEFMEEQEPEFITKLFIISDSINLPKLKAESLQTISWRFDKVLDTESWASIDSDPNLRREVMKAAGRNIAQKSKLRIEKFEENR